MNRYEEYSPLSLFRLRQIEHYYGDYVRQLFVLAAALFIIAIPISGNVLPFGPAVEVGGALLLVALAGVTNPHSKAVMLCDAVVSGIAILLIESIAITSYTGELNLALTVREAVAVLLLIAFYFSVKTLRAMLQGKVGQYERLDEFQDNL